jgi:hypothetical protein
MWKYQHDDIYVEMQHTKCQLQLSSAKGTAKGKQLFINKNNERIRNVSRRKIK